MTTNPSPTPSRALHALWGKTYPQGAPDSIRHPLLWHLLDTAAVAAALWDHYVSDQFRATFTATLNVTEPQGRAWLAFLAACHDLGKAEAGFQGQDSRWGAHAHRHGSPCLGEPKRYAHEQWGAALLSRHLETLGADPADSWCWAGAVSLKNGRPPQVDIIFRLQPLLPASGPWADVVTETITRLAATLRLGDVTFPEPTVLLLNRVAGIAKIADWVASNPRHFPLWDQPDNVDDYWARAQTLADTTVTTTGLTRVNQPTAPMPFEDQFPGYTPNALQQATDRIGATLDLPSLTFIEAPTGHGKTEAALALCHHQIRRGSTGLYMALPSRATAAQAHQRVLTWLRTTGIADTATLNISDPHRYATDLGDDDADPWFREAPHRTLICRSGVGSQDQVLLTVQPVRFDVVRWAGLEGRTFIFDEVHAYDTFQQTLFCAALTWLAAFGCPTIIMSATLPSEARQAFADAYLRGLNPDTEPRPITTAGYPQITTITATETRAETIPLEHGRNITLEHATATTSTATTITNLVTGRVPVDSHGVILIVCNSVRTTNETRQALEQRYPEGTVLTLHGRHISHDTKRHTAAIIDAAGKPSLAHRDHQLRIIVASPIVEQGLDLDADWTITEIAPIDLVIQRAGRSHRWPNTPRPTWGLNDTVTVIHPPHTGDTPDLARTSYVYYRDAPRTMLATWAALTSRNTITTADTATLIETVYTKPTRPDTIPETAWQEACAREQHVNNTYDAQANNLRLADPVGDDPWAAWTQQQTMDTPEGDLRYTSRSMEPTITLALAYPTPGGHTPAHTPTTPTPWDDLDTWQDATLTIAARHITDDLHQPEPWRTGTLRHTHLYTLTADTRWTYNPRDGLTQN